MTLKNCHQLPGAGRTRAWHYHGSHTPTSPGAIAKWPVTQKHFTASVCPIFFLYITIVGFLFERTIRQVTGSFIGIEAVKSINSS